MYFSKNRFNLYKKILAAFFLLFSNFFIYSNEFPKRLSNHAVISILFVNYNDFGHSLFSKSCLRIYDRETQFDKIIDFVHFENFDDEFFMLKFFLKEKKAAVRIEDFLTYFLEYSQKKNVSLTESALQLDSAEVDYIFNFISTMYKALPNYEYEFDILANNSETHISQILHDCVRMAGNELAGEEYSFSKITKHNLYYKKINNSYTLVSEKEDLTFNTQDFSARFQDEKKSLFIILITLASFVFLLTSYQVLVYFFDRLYKSAVFKTAQIIDFLFLFITGLAGFIIVWFDLFSNQVLFKNNIQFLFLFPLHTVIAFTLFKKIQNKKIITTYWSVVIISLLFYTVLSAIQRKLSIINFLCLLPFFFRCLYYEFLAFASFFEHTSRISHGENAHTDITEDC